MPVDEKQLHEKERSQEAPVSNLVVIIVILLMIL
jgi:hypothetical protein